MDMKWVIENDLNKEDVYSLASQLSVPHIIAQILVRRGIRDADSARKFFSPEINQLYDPFLMKDMSEAVERLRRAVLGNEKILIYGDYDVDGRIWLVIAGHRHCKRKKH